MSVIACKRTDVKIIDPILVKTFSIDLDVDIFNETSINGFNLKEIKYRDKDTILILLEGLQRKIFEYNYNEKFLIDSFTIPNIHNVVQLIEYKNSDSIVYIDFTREDPGIVFAGKNEIYKRIPFGIIMNDSLIVPEFMQTEITTDKKNYFFELGLICNDSNLKTYTKDKSKIPKIGKFYIVNDTLVYEGINIKSEFNEELFKNNSLSIGQIEYTFKNENTLVYIESCSNNIFEYDLIKNTSKKFTVKNSAFLIEPIFYAAGSKNSKGEDSIYEVGSIQSHTSSFFFSKKYSCYFRRICIRKINEDDTRYLEILNTNFEVKTTYKINEGMCVINDDIYFKVKDRKKKTITYEKLVLDIN